MKKIAITLCFCISLIFNLSAVAELNSEPNNYVNGIIHKIEGIENIKEEQNSTSHAEATQKRNVIEFCELYMYRYLKYQYENGLALDIHVYTHNPNYDTQDLEMWSSVNPDETTLHMHCTAGSLIVSTKDYTVNSITMVFVDINATDEDNLQYVMRSMMALSALEYNETDEALLRIQSVQNGGSETAIMEAIRLLTDEISNNIEDAMQKAIDTGEEVKVYSGNYDYYIAHVDGISTDNFEYIYLIARARD